MKIFVDFDDTLAMSSVTVVQYLNERYGLSKAVTDVHDWCYRSIYRHMTPKMVEDIYAGDYFWENVSLFHNAVDILRGHEVTVCSCGCSENLRRKAQFLSESSLGYGMAFINTDGGKKSGKDKCEFDMAGAIQIDDRVDSLLYTNAAVKILFKNGNNHTWQNVPSGANIYVVDTWEEIKELLRWFNDNPDFSADR